MSPPEEEDKTDESLNSSLQNPGGKNKRKQTKEKQP